MHLVLGGSRMRRFLALAPALALLSTAPARADVVVPSDDVSTRVIVRESASRHSRDIGSLLPGGRAAHLGSETAWRRVRLEDDTFGFVSEAWTRVVPSSPEDKMAMGVPMATAINTAIAGAHIGSADILLTSWSSQPYLASSRIC